MMREVPYLYSSLIDYARESKTTARTAYAFVVTQRGKLVAASAKMAHLGVRIELADGMCIS